MTANTLSLSSSNLPSMPYAVLSELSATFAYIEFGANTVNTTRENTLSLSDDWRYKNTPASNASTFWQTAEESLNTADRILIIGVISGVVRTLLSLVQLTAALLNTFSYALFSARITPRGENLYKHGALNLLRGVIAATPLLGRILLAIRDEEKIRCAYENEYSTTDTLRLFCREDNKILWQKGREAFVETGNTSHTSLVVEIIKKIGFAFLL